MNDPFERDLAAWLREGPDRGPDEARRRAYASIRQVSQRPAWLVAVSGGAGVGRPSGYSTRQVAWVMVAVALALLVLIGAAMAGGLFRDPLRADVPPIVTQPSEPPSLATPLPDAIGTIAYSYGGRIELLDPVTGDRRSLQTETPAFCPTFSPDGSRLAYETESGLWIDELGGSPARMVASDPGAHRAVWAPDGSRLALATDGSPAMRIVRTDDGTTSEIALVDPSEIDDQHMIWPARPAWSPTGESIAISHRIAERVGPGSWRPGEPILLIVDPSASTRRVIEGGSAFFEPVWAPDGGSIYEFEGGILSRLDTTTGVRLPAPTGDPSSGSSRADAPLMSLDGRLLATDRYVDDDYRQLELVDTSSGEVRLLGGRTLVGGKYEWSPDSAQIAAFVDTDERRDLEITRIADALEVRIPLGPRANEWADLGSRWWDCISWTARQLPANVAEPPQPSGAIPTQSPGEPMPSAIEWHSFASSIYRYSIWYPTGWSGSQAAKSWSGAEPVWGQGVADMIIGPAAEGGPGRYQMQIAASPTRPDVSIDDWVAAHQEFMTPYGHLGEGDSGCSVPTGSGHQLFETDGSNKFFKGTIGGQPARVRKNCGYVTAVVLADDRAYAISMFVGTYGESMSTPPHPNYRLFDQIALAISFEPLSSGLPDRSFSSRYGYSIDLGYAAIATPSDRGWEPADGWLWDADFFELWSNEWIRIASAVIPSGMSEEQWKAAYLPACQSEAAADWSPGILGSDVAFRHCDSAHGFVGYAIVGRRVYAFDGHGAPLSLFDFLSTIEFHPEEATTGS